MWALNSGSRSANQHRCREKPGNKKLASKKSGLPAVPRDFLIHEPTSERFLFAPLCLLARLASPYQRRRKLVGAVGIEPYAISKKSRKQRRCSRSHQDNHYKHYNTEAEDYTLRRFSALSSPSSRQFLSQHSLWSLLPRQLLNSGGAAGSPDSGRSSRQQ